MVICALHFCNDFLGYVAQTQLVCKGVRFHFIIHKSIGVRHFNYACRPFKVNKIEVTSNQQSLIKLKTQQDSVLKRNITRDKMHIYLIQPIQITLN